MAGSGLSPGESGNLSCRVADGFLITRTRVALAAIEPEDWVLVSGVNRPPRGEVLVESRGAADPSRDAAVHATVYEQLPGAAAIFHLHVGRLDELQGRLGVPATTTYYQAGTRESMEEIERFLTSHPATRYFVLVDHGIVAWGESIDDTGALVEAHQRALEEGG